eukprot:CAMPEP_0182543094 /NCGR_PEP_ID=MMETSP1323-20130603/31115_1 /TAXON_ID=236787 /ORGANISM="Florenciella parvula, Strain RCC1693" /LENGTH=47 /DNA_ID= /DNA_START= /DNA_END= /DNA_ORIENTATION=
MDDEELEICFGDFGDEEAERARVPEPEPLGRPALAGKDGRHPLESGW